MCCHFHENRCYFIFSTLYSLIFYLWPLKPHNFKSMCRISKIITFLESLRQAGWFDLFESDIQALLIFDPLITLWGNFDAPYLKLLNDASVASACFYVRTCRRVRNSKKIATIRDFHLPGSFLCLSTRLTVGVNLSNWFFKTEFRFSSISRWIFGFPYEPYNILIVYFGGRIICCWSCWWDKYV